MKLKLNFHPNLNPPPLPPSSLAASKSRSSPSSPFRHLRSPSAVRRPLRRWPSSSSKVCEAIQVELIQLALIHRNCWLSNFHPFGEFFASGSPDTNLKILDIRRKGCIHTYTGHARVVKAIRFTPDGR